MEINDIFINNEDDRGAYSLTITVPNNWSVEVSYSIEEEYVGTNSETRAERPLWGPHELSV